jgi:hypothetical protein
MVNTMSNDGGTHNNYYDSSLADKVHLIYTETIIKKNFPIGGRPPPLGYGSDPEKHTKYIQQQQVSRYKVPSPNFAVTHTVTHVQEFLNGYPNIPKL